jgi:hypothetical protein
MKSSRIGFCKLKKYAQHIPKINAAQSKNKKAGDVLLSHDAP